MLRSTYTLAIFLALMSCRPGVADDRAAEIAEAEKALKNANIATDGPNLLDYLRTRTLSEAQVKGLAANIPKLGDKDFATREQASAALREAGNAVLPLMREAVKDPDPEIQRRAQEILLTLRNGRYVEQICAVIT